ncbi:hypothetical protein GCM10009850_107900 [Nonomuraea monospora]|uniref:Uncharacterized protein n=1 Tax=Nonomuraea monospora TaxID=568818 RepID=A0ABP5PUB8_9ACTN
MRDALEARGGVLDVVEGDRQCGNRHAESVLSGRSGTAQFSSQAPPPAEAPRPSEWVIITAVIAGVALGLATVIAQAVEGRQADIVSNLGGE